MEHIKMNNYEFQNKNPYYNYKESLEQIIKVYKTKVVGKLTHFLVDKGSGIGISSFRNAKELYFNDFCDCRLALKVFNR